MRGIDVMKRYNPLFEKESYYEMSNLTFDDTGLPFIIWISPMSGKEGHWARIKVEYEGIYYPISISDTPEWKVKSIPFSGKQTKLIKEFIIIEEEIVLLCNNCNHILPSDSEKINCPKCGAIKFDILSGMGVEVISVE